MSLHHFNRKTTYPSLLGPKGRNSIAQGGAACGAALGYVGHAMEALKGRNKSCAMRGALFRPFRPYGSFLF